MLDIVVEMMLCQGSGSLGEEEERRGEEDVYKGYAPMAVNLQMAYPSGDGVVAEDRHVRESLVGATASGVINMAEVRRLEGPSLPNQDALCGSECGEIQIFHRRVSFVLTVDCLSIPS
jgi:hypothetical protein